MFLSLHLVALDGQSLQDSLLMHFRFDGDSLDSGPHQVAAAFEDWTVPWPEPFTYAPDRFGVPDFAVAFHPPLHNHIDYVAADTTLLYPDFPVTFASWMLMESHNTTNCFFHLNTSACFCSPHNEAFGGIWLEVRRNARKLSAGFGDGVNGYLLSHMRFREGTRELALHTWYHVATVVRGPDDIELYVNGKNDCGSYYGTGDSLDYCDECSGAGLQQYHGSLS